jgi:hypothetical protein
MGAIMKYFTRENYERNFKTVEIENFTINDLAQNKDEILYQQLYTNTYNHYCTAWGYKLNDFEFNTLLDEKITSYKERLPDYIINKIADIRVTVMGVVSQEIYDSICKYNNQLLRYCENLISQYRKEYSESIKHLSDCCKHALDCNISDAKIIKFEQSNNQLHLYFSLDTYTKDQDYDLLFIFTEGTFIEKFGLLNNDYLLTYEIYALESSIEYHMLFQNSQFIIKANDLVSQYSESYKYREGLD